MKALKISLLIGLFSIASNAYAKPCNVTWFESKRIDSKRIQVNAQFSEQKEQIVNIVIWRYRHIEVDTPFITNKKGQISRNFYVKKRTTKLPKIIFTCRD